MILLLCGLMLAAPVFAQRGPSDPLFAEVPLAKWIAEGPRTEVPWKVRVFSEGLSLHQRLLAHVEAQVDGKELVKRRGNGRLLILLQFEDHQGKAYQDDAALELKDVQPGARKTKVIFVWEAFVLPGEYEVTLALYDTATGEHNLAQRRLRIEALKQDALRDAWRDLPSVEIFREAEPPDLFFRPEIVGRLRLPLRTRRPVQIELLVNLTPSEYFSGSRRAYNFNLSVLLPMLKALSQIDVQNGTLNVTTLDMARRRVSFEQENVKDLDWLGLKAAIAASDPGVIDVRELQDRKENAAFLRKELARRLEARRERPSDAKAPEASPKSPAADPLRVFLLIGTPMAFESGSRLKPLTLPEGCNCTVHYLRYEAWPSRIASRFGLFSGAGVDDVAGILKPLKPRVLSAHSAEDLRKRLATLLDEISKM